MPWKVQYKEVLELETVVLPHFATLAIYLATAPAFKDYLLCEGMLTRKKTTNRNLYFRETSCGGASVTGLTVIRYPSPLYKWSFSTPASITSA